MKSSSDFINDFKFAKERNHAVGCIATLSKNGNTQFQSELGYSDLLNKIPVNSDTVFGLASITKMFTAIAVLQLFEKGKLKLTDAIINYFPEFKIGSGDVNGITIHHFLTHSSGIPPLFALEYAIKRPDPNEPTQFRHVGEDKSIELLDTYDQLIEYINKQPIEPLGRPGEVYSYSNEAYSLLGGVVEKVSGMTYKDYVMKEIVEKVDLKMTGFNEYDFDSSVTLSKSYGTIEINDKTEVTVDPSWADSDSMRATGFLKSSTSDMLEILQLFHKDGLVNEFQLLSPESVKKMTTPHIRINEFDSYGYGVRITKNMHGEEMIWHGGSLKAVSSCFAVLPKSNISVVVLANKMGFPAIRSAQKLINISKAKPIDSSPYDISEAEISENQKQKFIGTYRNLEGSDIEIKAVDGIYEFIAGEVFPIRFISEQSFLVMYLYDFAVVEMVKVNNDVIGISYGSRVVFKQ